MKVYTVVTVTIIEGIESHDIDSIWFTEEDAYERADTLDKDETTDFDYIEIGAMEVHGKQHLKVISKVIEDDERK